MYQDRYWHDNVFDTVDAAGEARRRSRASPLPTLAVAWVLAQPGDHLADRRREPARAARRDAAPRSTRTLDADLARHASTSSPRPTAAATHRVDGGVAPASGCYGVSFTHQLIPAPVSPVAFAVSRKHGLDAFGIGFGTFQIHTVFFKSGS